MELRAEQTAREIEQVGHPNFMNRTAVYQKFTNIKKGK